MDHLRERSADRLHPGTPRSSLNGLHPEARTKACRKTDAELRGVSGGRDCQRHGCLRKAQERQGLARAIPLLGEQSEGQITQMGDVAAKAKQDTWLVKHK